MTDEPSTPAPTCSMRARADAIRRSNLKYARALGVSANLQGGTGDNLQLLMMSPVALVALDPTPAPSLPEIKRDPYTLEIIEESPFNPPDPNS